MPDLTLTLIGSQLVSPDQRTRLYWGSDNALYRNTGTTFAPEKVSGSSGVDPVTITAGTGISVTNSGSVYTVATDSTVVTNITANSPLSASRNGNQVTLSLNTSNLVSSVQVSGGLLTRSTSGSTTTIGLTTDAIGITLTGNNGVTVTKNAWNSFTITGPDISSGTTVAAGTGISVSGSASSGYTVSLDSDLIGTAGSTFFIYKDQLVVNGRNAVLQDTKMNVSASGSVISLNGSNAQVFILDPISASSYTIVTSNIPENTAIVLIFTYVSGATITFAGNVITDDLSDGVMYAMTFMNTDDTVYATMPVKLIS
jgi:hypothetical protein